MALAAISSISDEELARWVRDCRPDAIIWAHEMAAGAIRTLREWHDPIFRVWRSRPHTDDMRAMLDDLGIEVPDVRHAPEFIDVDWSFTQILDFG